MSIRRNVAVLVATAVGLGGLAFGPGSTAFAAPAAPPLSAVPAPEPPKGWTVTSDAGTDHLLWRASEAVTGDAQVRFFAGDLQLPGLPRPARDGRSFRLDVPTGTLTDAAELQVRAGGRRLDAAGVSALRSSRALASSTTVTPAALPPVTVDPGVAGSYQTVTGEYTLASVKLPDFPEAVEMQAVVVAPKGATGKHPLALFLHGRHSICYGSDTAEEAWPCPAGSKPIPSYRGYLRAQKLLASQGYVTVSISANGINGQDFASDDGGAQARSSLIRLHLAHWADWADGQAGAPAIVQAAPVADLSKVLLMGHSRGGDGVNRAAIDSLTPPPSAIDGYHGPVRWKIRGTLLLAPTLFGHNPEADVPSVVVLPGCDGDVYDLQGQFSVDGTPGRGTGTSLHSAAFVVGANHNYFNSEWTPKLAAAPAWDDWFDTSDKVCGTGKKSLRLTPVQQQKVGATYIAAAARSFIKDDDKVLPLLDGSAVRAPSVGTARVLSHAVGAARVPFVQPATTLKVAGAGKTKVRLCREATQGRSACIAAGKFVTVPHFVPFEGATEEPDRYAVALAWTKAGGLGARLQPSTPVSLAASKSVTMRVFVPTNSPTKKFDVAVTDSAGRKATLGRVSITGLAGTSQTVGYWGQELRVSLTAARAAKLDLKHVKRLALIPRTASGTAWLLDAWGWKTGTPAVTVAPNSRIDVGTIGKGQVDETDGPATHLIPITIAGDGGGQIRVYVSSWMTGESSTRLVTIPAGTHQVTVPIKVSGDTTFGENQYYTVLAEAVKGTVVGDYAGSLEVVEDEPAPKITVRTLIPKIPEGMALVWQVQLSEPVGVGLYLPLTFLPPTGPELSTTDLPKDWVESELGVPQSPSRKLSSLKDSYLGVYVPAGSTRVAFFLPSAKDSKSEGPEQVRIQVQPIQDPPPPVLPEMTGTITD
jgi:hypothetical protein